MSVVVIDTYDSSGDVVKKETTTYVYDETGTRIGLTHKVEEDTDQDPHTALVTTSETDTTYLVDDMNPTGYAQVIEEITRDASTQNVTGAKLFTLGHDVIDQTTFTPGNSQAGSAYTLMYDGHGSTRALLDAAAAFVQHYAYTAYGKAIGFDEAQALTALLYSGEAFDSRIGLQYLRARWYDPNIGRFNRLDPFSGNLSDPQSLHKYLYVHGHPPDNRWITAARFSFAPDYFRKSHRRPRIVAIADVRPAVPAVVVVLVIEHSLGAVDLRQPVELVVGVVRVATAIGRRDLLVEAVVQVLDHLVRRIGLGIAARIEVPQLIEEPEIVVDRLRDVPLEVRVLNQPQRLFVVFEVLRLPQRQFAGDNCWYYGAWITGYSIPLTNRIGVMPDIDRSKSPNRNTETFASSNSRKTFE